MGEQNFKNHCGHKRVGDNTIPGHRSFNVQPPFDSLSLAIAVTTSLTLTYLLSLFFEMESRKRPRTEDGDVVQAKKRALSTSHDSPVAVNGDADEPKDNDSLEVTHHP